MITYRQWVAEQAAHVESEMRRFGRLGVHDEAAYVMPSNRATPGRLVVATETPEGAVNVLRFPPNGSTRLGMVPYSHLSSLIYNLCRSEPVLPTEEPKQCTTPA